MGRFRASLGINELRGYEEAFSKASCIDNYFSCLC
jgi:hypothetical protein